MQGKQRISLSLPLFTRDDFTLQGNLISLFLLVEYVHQHRLDPAILSTLLAVVRCWRRGEWGEVDGFASLMAQQYGEAREVLICI